MTVQAKFQCQRIEHIHTGGADQVAEIKLHAVWGDGKGNESWSKATPSGEIKMMITNPAAIAAFELGKSYILTFDPAH